MSIVIGLVAKIMTRYLSIDVYSASSWNVYIRLSSDSYSQLEFWKDTFRYVNLRNIFGMENLKSRMLALYVVFDYLPREVTRTMCKLKYFSSYGACLVMNSTRCVRMFSSI